MATVAERISVLLAEIDRNIVTCEDSIGRNTRRITEYRTRRALLVAAMLALPPAIDAAIDTLLTHGVNLGQYD